MFPVITTVVIIYVIIIPATPIPIHSLRLAPVRKAPVLTSGMQRRQTRHDDSAMWWHLSKMVSRTVAVSTREKHYLHPGGKKEHWVILMFYKKKPKQSNTPENPWFARQVYREASPLNFASFWLEKSFGSRLPGYRTSTALQICDRSIQQTCA